MPGGCRGASEERSVTTLDRQLAQTFRAARWIGTLGKPVCPDCFDGDALLVDESPRLGHAGLKSYRCRDCNTRFSDLSGTPLRGSSFSLRDWAIALMTLNGHPTQPSGSGARMQLAPIDLGPTLKTLARMRTRWTASRFGMEWASHLRASRITLNKLRYDGRAA